MAESDFEKCVKALRRLDLFYERRLQRLRRAECRVHEMSAAELRVFEAAIALEEERLRERVVHGTLRMGEDPTAPAT